MPAQVYGLVVVVEGSFRLAHLVVEKAAVNVEISLIWLKTQQQGILPDRLPEISQLLKGLGSPQIETRVFGFGQLCLVEIFGGFQKIGRLAAKIGQAPLLVAFASCAQLDRLRQHPDGLLIALFAEKQLPYFLQGLHMLREGFQNGFKVFPCLREMVLKLAALVETGPGQAILHI